MKEVRKAVIPAAGWGTRFLPITRAQPKEMLPVVDKPVIQYVVEEAVSSGIEDILIITGRNKRAIEDHFDYSAELDQVLKLKNNKDQIYEAESLTNLADIHYIRQKYQKGLGDAILYAKDHCSDEPFVVLLGDTITIPGPSGKTCTSQMIDAYNRYNKPVIAIEPVTPEKIPDYGMIKGDLIEEGVYEIMDIIEKPKAQDAPSNLGAIGTYILTPEIFDLLHQVKPGALGELQLTDALRGLDKPIGLITDCKRYDIGDKPGWIRSTIELTLNRPEFREMLIPFMKEMIQKYE